VLYPLTIRDFLDRAEGFKCPKRVEFVTALPRTAADKRQKFKLREPFWAGHDRQVG
jgi:acyl-coenzyme A synthetase/AMP-(fatty) acid ligase